MRINQLDLAEVNEVLQFYIRPQTFPVAVKMCESSEDLPENTKRPKKDLGSAVAVCQGISLARRYGWTIAIGQEDESCSIRYSTEDNPKILHKSALIQSSV